MRTTLTLAFLSLVSAASLHAAYVGGSVGYWIDSEEIYFASQLGFELSAQTNNSHNLEVEILYFSEEEYDIDATFVPLMLNYRFKGTSNSITYSAGAGAGLSYVDIDASYFGSDSDTAITLQAFASVGYAVSEAVEIFGGLRYLWIDGVDVFGASTDSADDVAIEGGVRFRF